MSHKLRQLSGKQVVSIFEKFGYEVSSQHGSHIKMKRAESRIVLIPNHSITDKGTLKAIFNQALAIIPEKEIKKYFYSEDR
ncbi:MAG: type II toxin-antitoxin system HicA family toxin [Minisyncoccia bacterium]